MRRILNIPNLMTVGRFLLIPFFVNCFWNGAYVLAALIFVAAGITDWLDGYIARKWSIKTKLGAYLDPLADKCLIVTSYIVFALDNLIPQWFLGVVLARDVFILLGVMAYSLRRKKLKIAPLFVSKVNTVLQLALVMGILIEKIAGTDMLRLPLIACVLITTIWSWYGYARMEAQK